MLLKVNDVSRSKLQQARLDDKSLPEKMRSRSSARSCILLATTRYCILLPARYYFLLLTSTRYCVPLATTRYLIQFAHTRFCMLIATTRYHRLSNRRQRLDSAAPLWCPVARCSLLRGGQTVLRASELPAHHKGALRSLTALGETW